MIRYKTLQGDLKLASVGLEFGLPMPQQQIAMWIQKQISFWALETFLQDEGAPGEAATCSLLVTLEQQSCTNCFNLPSMQLEHGTFFPKVLISNAKDRTKSSRTTLVWVNQLLEQNLKTSLPEVLIIRFLAVLHSAVPTGTEIMSA